MNQNLFQTKHIRGFTLVELLIAISIIAIISVVGFTSFSQAQVRARDAKRKQDLRSIAIALELYYQKNKRFPCVSNSENGGFGFLLSNNNPTGFWIEDKATGGLPSYCGTDPFNSNYINQLPTDPIANGGTPYKTPGTTGYAYFGGANCGLNYGQFYALTALLENPNDPDANLKKNYKWCDGSSLSHWDPKAFIITSK